MVDDVKDITETAESKASQEALDRGRVARARREAEQRARLDELRAHAAAAQAQRERRDEDRRRRQAEQRARDDDRRVQVEERKRAIWEASVSRREALVQRERERSERLERQRAARSAPRPAFAFGSSTPRLLEPLDSGGFFWAARSTNPIDQMNFFESLAASTTNVMFASAPLTRRASALHLDSSDTDNKDEPDRQQVPAMWSSVARRRTDLVPTLPAPRAPGRAYSMTRLDRLPHSPATHLSRTQTRSGETTPSRPGSALSAAAGVLRRPTPAARKPRPASIAGTGVNTPRGGVGDTLAQSAATTPTVSRDSTVVGSVGTVPRRPATTPRRPRPASMHTTTKPATPAAPGEGKPPLHRKPKSSKEHDRTPRGKSASASPGRGLSPSPPRLRASSRDKELFKLQTGAGEKRQINAAEVTHKLEALQIQNGDHDQVDIETQDTVAETKTIETKPEIKPTETVEQSQESKTIENIQVKTTDNIQVKTTEITDVKTTQNDVKLDEPKEHEVESVDKETPKLEKEEKAEKKEDKRDEKKEPSIEKTDDSEMTASMSGRRITTEEEAKAALAERRRRARDQLEKQAELERQRLQREAEEEAERQRLEREREAREEQEARELARLQRSMEEEKLRRAIEAQQQLEREEVERKSREEAERQARLKEEEEKRRAAEEAEKQRKEEAEREEKERLARKQRVEAIMARTRLRKAEEDKKQAESKQPLPGQPQAPAEAEPAPAAHPPDNGNVPTDDLLGFAAQPDASAPAPAAAAPARLEDGSGDAPHNNGNLTADLLTLSQQTHIEDKTVEVPPTKTATIDNTTLPAETNNGNLHADQLSTNMSANLSTNFIQNEIASNEAQTKMADNLLLDDDFTTHNGHGTINHPLTVQNAI